MTKQDLINDIAERAGTSAVTANNVVDAFVASMTEVMHKKETVSLPGFGTFSAKERAARKGRNPSTGEAIDIAAANVPTFKAAPKLKTTLNP